MSNELLFYVKIGNLDKVKELIENGADVNAKDRSGNTPLHWMACGGYGHIEIAKLLIDNGADVNAKNKRRITPLDMAKFEGHTEIVKLLKKREETLFSYRVIRRMTMLFRALAKKIKERYLK